MFYGFSSDEMAFFPSSDCTRNSSYCTTSAFLQTSGWQMTSCIDIKAVGKFVDKFLLSGISSYFHILKPQSCLFVRLRWGLKTIFFVRILRKYKSGNVLLRSPGTPCSTQKHRAWIYTNAELYSHTVNVFVELKTVFGLQMSYLLLFWWLHSSFLFLWFGKFDISCMQLLP